MRDFIYTDGEHNLNINSSRWLNRVGLRETRWILDTEWLCNGNDFVFSDWINE